ncbi:hypothetical protein PRK78_002866 [Emydomyces testavorans]|uniref:Uncharacterized protein n=1 Tax=Emydomyces testavorans TaxID=2070801 RepID=A0AAF0DF31_9EURO|nr:hypothetical protein PRK78_002866 [Emydomyces testavorans]
MHQVPSNHVSQGCNISNELHDKRHREIARIIQKLQELDEQGECLTSNTSELRLSHMQISDENKDEDECISLDEKIDYGPPITPTQNQGLPPTPGAPRKNSFKTSVVGHRSQSLKRVPRASSRLRIQYQPSPPVTPPSLDSKPVATSSQEAAPQKVAVWRHASVFESPEAGTRSNCKAQQPLTPELGATAQQLSCATPVKKTMTRTRAKTICQFDSPDILLTPKLGQSPAKIKREEKKALKYAKSTGKALRRQSMSDPFTIITNEAVEKVNDAIHGSCKLLSSMSPEEVKEVFIKNLALYNELQMQLAHIKPSDEAKYDNKYEALTASRLKLKYVQEVLDKLGIQPTRPKENKERKALIYKMLNIIFLDLEYQANEARETLRRAAGYWRFVNKRAYLAMVENNKMISWETGEKINEEDLGSSDQE